MQKAGGAAALYLAAAYAAGIALFLVVLDYPHMVEPAQRVALLVDRPAVIFLTNLVMYVVFGAALVVLALALRERTREAAPGLSSTAAAVGVIWAGMLIASGMVANAAIGPVTALAAKDPAQAAAAWLAIEVVAGGLSSANGEIVGGLWVLLVTWAAWQARSLPRGLNYLGLLVGAVGLLSAAPGLADLTGLFGVSQLLWFVWLGATLLRSGPLAAEAQPQDGARPPAWTTRAP